jgi:hypothetical protein
VITFEKKHTGGSVNPGEVRIYVYEAPKAKSGAVQIIIRIPRHMIEAAGWFIGDYAVPSVDPTKREWLLTRTTDRTRGYMVSSTQKNGGAAAYLKLTAPRDEAGKVVPGGGCSGRITDADARRIGIAY